MRENNLERFIKAQESDYKTAFAEIKNGHKRSCWMWYIFPQIQGLGSSGTAMYYSIEDYEEAKAYIENAVTNAHLREISEALLQLESNDATRVMGWPDDLKLRSSMTLFALATKENEVFRKVLDKFFDGKLDAQTVDILNMGHLVMQIEDPDFGCEGRPDGEEAMAKVYLKVLKTEEEFQTEIPDAELYQKEINEGDEVAFSPDGVILKL
nr:DUF1810 domain-containing protein [uncultured Dorea sp.]